MKKNKNNKVPRIFRFTKKENRYLKLKAKQAFAVPVSVQTYVIATLFKGDWENEYEEMERHA